jgi:predicted RNA binding protein YcfA (HicA-like mRNA interferase family)
VPRKIRQLIAELQRAGFVLAPHRGKGSHRVFKHPMSGMEVVLSGQTGDDAERYQERDVREALAAIREIDQDREV